MPLVSRFDPQLGYVTHFSASQTGLSNPESGYDRCMVDETSDRPRLTPKGVRTRSRIVEAAAALIHERGVAATTLEDVKAAADVSGSQLYHYFPDKNDLVQAVIDYQAETIVNNNRRALASAQGLDAWRNMLIRGVKSTPRERAAARLAHSVVSWPRATPRPEPSSPAGSITGQPPSAMDCGPCTPRGSSRPTSTRTTSPPPCSPPSKEGFSSPRFNGAPARSKPHSTPSSPWPSIGPPPRS